MSVLLLLSLSLLFSLPSLSAFYSKLSNSVYLLAYPFITMPHFPQKVEAKFCE